MKKRAAFRGLPTIAALAVALSVTSPICAAEQSAGDLAKASQNPVSTLISVPFENNLTFNNGPEDAVFNTLNVKPVLPMGLTENWNLINRLIVPAIWQQEPVDGAGNVFGLGDVTYQAFLSPKKADTLIWGVGPMLIMPTGMDRLTSDQWSLGAGAVGLVTPGPWVVGALVTNVWSVGGYHDAPNVNFFSGQYFLNYNMKGGWFLTMAPTITANWEAEDSGDRWTVPFGGGFGRVFKVGKQPVNASLRSYYSPVRPDNASDWNVQATLVFLFPK